VYSNEVVIQVKLIVYGLLTIVLRHSSNDLVYK
jgi:hypothetical protein